MNFGEPKDIGTMRGITPAVKYLIILNVAVYLIEGWFRIPLRDTFQLEAGWYQHLAVGQLFTYMFVHGSFSHLLMNMKILRLINNTVVFNSEKL